MLSTLFTPRRIASLKTFDQLTALPSQNGSNIDLDSKEEAAAGAHPAGSLPNDSMSHRSPAFPSPDAFDLDNSAPWSEPEGWGSAVRGLAGLALNSHKSCTSFVRYTLKYRILGRGLF